VNGWEQKAQERLRRFHGKGIRRGQRVKQQWCYRCGAEHDFHEPESPEMPGPGYDAQTRRAWRDDPDER